MSAPQVFNQLNIPEAFKASLARIGFETLTEIQAATINNAMAGRDILGSSQTGTGKTAAYAVPLLNLLYRNPGKQALVVVPTRELGTQIHRVLRQMTKGMHMNGTLILGGESFNRQITEVENTADYLIATPGRLCDHLSKNSFSLSRVAMLVLDEVDLMMDLGFAAQIEEITKHLPAERQTLFFSATLPASIVALAEKLLNKPVRTTVGDTTQPVATVEHVNLKVMTDKKQELLLKEARDRKGSMLVFTRTKEGTEHLAKVLARNGHSVDFLHGERTMRQRREAIAFFKNGERRILVATDIAARGLDIEGIEIVVNFHLPQSREDYIHRVGRTGRHGATGVSINFITPRDKNLLRRIGKIMGITDPDFQKGQGNEPKPKGMKPNHEPKKPNQQKIHKPQKTFHKSPKNSPKNGMKFGAAKSGASAGTKSGTKSGARPMQSAGHQGGSKAGPGGKGAKPFHRKGDNRKHSYQHP